MSISAILACDKNGVIGDGDKLPFRLKDDLVHFKAVTKDHIVIMGRKTFASIGKPLPNRINIVITSTPDRLPDGVSSASSLEEAIEHARWVQQYKEAKIFIIGGASVYNEAFRKQLVSEVYFTDVEVALTNLDNPIRVDLRFIQDFTFYENLSYPKSPRNQHSFKILKGIKPAL